MKALKGFIIAIIMTLVATTSFAAGSTDLTVQASVLGTCSFDAAAYTMDFGVLDPAAAANTNASAILGFTCSNGTAYAIDNLVLARNMVGGVTAASLPYTIAAYVNTGTGSGATQNLTLTGTVLATSYDLISGLPADAYAEVITININP